MHFHSYDGCQKCLIIACCSQVCEPYKKSVFGRFKLNIQVEKIDLEAAESIVYNFITSGNYYMDHPVSLQETIHGDMYLDIDYKLIPKHRR